MILGQLGILIAGLLLFAAVWVLPWLLALGLYGLTR